MNIIHGLVVAILLQSGFLTQLSFAQELLPGQKKFPPLKPQIVRDIVESAVTTKVLDIADPVQIFPSEPELSEFWLGNRPILSAAVDKFQYTFEMNEPGKEGVVFSTLNFTLNKSEIVVQHSRAAFPGQRGGIRIPGENHFTPHKFLYRALQGTSIVVFVPAFSRRENSRAVVFCPREFDTLGSREDRSRLTPTKWTLKEARVTASADVRGFVRSGFDMVKAYGEILTSPSLAPAIGWHDEIFSKNAAVSLFYKPKGNFTPRLLEGAPNAEGIESAVDLHVNTGFRRKSSLAAVAYMEPTSISELLVPVKVKDLGGTAIAAELIQRGITLEDQKVIEVQVKPGECYLVLNDTGTIMHEYLKEPLRSPKEQNP